MLVGVVGFLGSEVVLSPVVSGCLPSCGGWVLVGVAAFLGSEMVLSPVVSGCLPSCGGWVLVGVAASRTKTFRNQNHRFQSKFAYCKLFGVYAGVIFSLFFSLKPEIYGMRPALLPQVFRMVFSSKVAEWKVGPDVGALSNVGTGPRLIPAQPALLRAANQH